jgi:hypothetical protein
VSSWNAAVSLIFEALDKSMRPAFTALKAEFEVNSIGLNQFVESRSRVEMRIE